MMRYRILLAGNNFIDNRSTFKLLNKCGHEVVNTYHSINNLTQYFYNRKNSFKTANPETDTSMYIRKTLSLIIEYNIDVILPVSIETALALSDHRQEIEKHTHLVLPDNRFFHILCDNWLNIEYASRLNIPVPKSILAQTTKDAEKGLSELKFPLTLIPRQNALHQKTLRINNHSEFSKAIPKLLKESGSVILQEVSNDLNRIISVQAICIEGKIRHIYAYQPKKAGKLMKNGVSFQTVNNKDIENYVQVFLENLEWHGIVGMNFLIDNKDNLKLTSIDPLMNIPVIKSDSQEIQLADILIKGVMGERS